MCYLPVHSSPGALFTGNLLLFLLRQDYMMTTTAINFLFSSMKYLLFTSRLANSLLDWRLFSCDPYHLWNKRAGKAKSQNLSNPHASGSVHWSFSTQGGLFQLREAKAGRLKLPLFSSNYSVTPTLPDPFSRYRVF